MNQAQQNAFTLSCSICFDLTQADINALLKSKGLSMQRNSLLACEEAVRDFVGEARWQDGVQIVEAHLRAVEQERASHVQSI